MRRSFGEKSWLRMAIWALILVPIVVRPTSPGPPPWHQFFVSGWVESTSGGSVDNYTVVLYGTVNGSWRMLHSCWLDIIDEWGGSRDIMVTGTQGRFYLSVWSCEKPESLAAAVVLPDTIILGSRRARASLDFQTHERTYQIDGSGSFCDDDDEVTVVDGYMYFDLDSLSVQVR